MKIGIIVGCICACAWSLAGCESDPAAVNALVTSVTTDPDAGIVSSISSTKQTSAEISIDQENATATVAVKNGGLLSGPKTFNLLSAANGYVYGETDSQDSVLYASALDNSYHGIVAGRSGGNADIASGFGGTVPTGTSPAGAVTYNGTAIAALAKVGSGAGEPKIGTSEIEADFSNGTVGGTLDFTGQAGPTLSFTGSMSTDMATYSGTNVTYDAAAATGQVIGGFFGPDYVETAGAFDIRASDGWVAGGAYGASSAP